MSEDLKKRAGKLSLFWLKVHLDELGDQTWPEPVNMFETREVKNF